MAEGFGVVVDGQIDVRTVSPTRRAAIVNWLVVERRIMIYDHDGDEKIDRLWEALKPDDADVVEVWIEVNLKEVVDE